jgi:hypothetical protein
MRILIEHDAANMTTEVTTPSSVAQAEAENGGAAPEATGGSRDAAADDAGGPPQWLLDAVGQAMAQEGSSSGATAADAADGGAAPASTEH